MDLLKFQERINKVREFLKINGFGLQFVCSLYNLSYFTGVHPLALERLTLLSISQEGKPTIILPRLSEQEFKHLGSDFNLRVWEDGQDPIKFVEEELQRLPPGLPLLLDRGTPGYLVLALSRLLPIEQILFNEEAIKALRQKKEGEEIELLKASGAIADQVLRLAFDFAKPGMTELEVASYMITEIMKRGALADPPVPTVASGPNSAVPHHQTGSRRLQFGEPLLIDFGCVFNGYYSDITRTIFLGEPSEEFQMVYRIVKEAQEKALSKIRPGIPLGSIDREAREHIANSGFGDYFIHRLGHGLGMEIHEEPYVFSENSDLIEVGMCFSVEPGIYLPGNFGVRIEDCVVVQEEGPLLLTHSPK
ncbi:MAG: Xaa-Pro peptidase family protein [Caldiserica bacterium]|jgi:Xaa-Pro dipeptidase|nr:Xaa-Pro peptidase family protein [Caldisericota bacterium]MDH7562203.1 Xaa-Pro peptidase family protein [Caldisericota bacterium]